MTLEELEQLEMVAKLKKYDFELFQCTDNNRYYIAMLPFQYHVDGSTSLVVKCETLGFNEDGDRHITRELKYVPLNIRTLRHVYQQEIPRTSNDKG